jgi:hypothetical protein
MKPEAKSEHGEKEEQHKPPSPVRRASKGGTGPAQNSVVDLQRSIGNQGVIGLLNSGAIKAKLRVSQPGDADEIEADRVAQNVVASPAIASATTTTPAAIHRKCACPAGAHTCPECEIEEVESAKGIHRKSSVPSPIATLASEEFLPNLGPGEPLDSAARASMEPHFQRDFSNVRIHVDARADAAAKQIDAIAFAHGNHIFFGKGNYDPHGQQGRGILAHELAHVAQSDARSKTPPDKRADTVRRLTPAEFQKQLGATSDQQKAIATLFANSTFISLWNYLKKCTAATQQDLGPLQLKVSPGLKIGGAERFGGYDPRSRTLEINPTKPEHKANPSELVDTITHELIHAVDNLAAECKKAGAGDAPLAGAATAQVPLLADVAGTPQEKQLMLDQGPGASNPCEEFLDINKAAQQMVIQIIRENIKVAKVGRPTITFVNEILRQDPKAMTAYVACRDLACAKKKPEDRQKAMATCSADVIARFMPKSLAP